MGGPRKAIKDMFARNKWKILRGDTVFIAAGKDKGQTGTVSRVIRDAKEPKVVVEGRNLNKKHIKRSENHPGGIVTVEAPLAYSNVQLVDPVTKAPCRVTWRYLEDGTKVRITKGKLASGSVIPRPEILKQRRKPHPLPGPKDTPATLAVEQTYQPGDTLSMIRQYSTSTAAQIHGLRCSAGHVRQVRQGWASRMSWRGFAASCCQ